MSKRTKKKNDEPTVKGTILTVVMLFAVVIGFVWVVNSIHDIIAC